MIEERHVFISYRRQEPDKRFANRLAGDLRAAGHHVWIDVEGIEGAENWTEEIQAAIDGCYAYVLILSPDSLASRWVRNELLYALGRKSGRVYPVMFREAPLPLELVAIQYIDFTGGYQPALTQLLQDLPEPPRIGPRLPAYLEEALESQTGSVHVRRGAVQALVDLARGPDQNLAAFAREWLVRLAQDDADEQVRQMARDFLVEAPAPPPAQEPPIPIAPTPAQVREKEPKPGRRAVHPVLLIVLIIAGFTIGELMAPTQYIYTIADLFSEGIGIHVARGVSGFVVGAFGGAAVGAALTMATPAIRWQQALLIAGVWIVARIIEWITFGSLWEIMNWPIDWLIAALSAFALGGLLTALTLRHHDAAIEWKHVPVITLGWVIAEILITSILIYSYDTGGWLSNPIPTSMLIGICAGVIGGGATLWQISRAHSQE